MRTSTKNNIYGTVWGLKARIIKLLDQDVLLMPVLKTLTDQTKPTETEKEATKKAVQQLVSNNYIHKDLHWRHVGFYGKGTKKSPLKAVLIYPAITTDERDETTKIIEL